MTPEAVGAGAVIAALGAVGYGPQAVHATRRVARSLGSRGRLRRREVVPAWDPGRELRAERRARELLRSVVGPDEFEMYAALGFLAVPGGAGESSGYGYLVYPHRPLVAYDTRSGELLSEYCVGFPDRSGEAAGSRLPDADDVLAKWMSLRGRERELIAESNLHAPGRQLDPAQVRRDLLRLREWRGRRARTRASDAAPVPASTSF